MDSISYINDLQLEIKMLEDVKANGNCNVNIINKQIEEKLKLIERCKDNLSKISNNKIEYRLYLAIINGLNPSKAVAKIANENYINNISPSSIASIWRIYKKMKKNINF